MFGFPSKYLTKAIRKVENFLISHAKYYPHLRVNDPPSTVGHKPLRLITAFVLIEIYEVQTKWAVHQSFWNTYLLVSPSECRPEDSLSMRIKHDTFNCASHYRKPQLYACKWQWVGLFCIKEKIKLCTSLYKLCTSNLAGSQSFKVTYCNYAVMKLA